MIVMPYLEQGTDAWLRERIGIPTGSVIDQVLTATRKPSSQSKKLMARLVAEQILQEPLDDFKGSYWTDRGKQFEGEAGAYFSLMTDLEPQAVGFVYRDETRTAGCSPDWLVPDAGGDWIAGVEVKCPAAATHMLYLMDDEAKQYTPQVQYSLWITQLPVWYFMSYYPGLPPLLREIKPDPDWQAAFDEHMPEFIAELQDAVKQWRHAK